MDSLPYSRYHIASVFFVALAVSEYHPFFFIIKKLITFRGSYLQVEKEFGFPVVGIITLDDLVSYMSTEKYTKGGKEDILINMKRYRETFGIQK